MKLRTEMQDTCVHARGYCVDEDGVDYEQAVDMVHDAAAAHALMQAREQIEKQFDIAAMHPVYVLDSVFKRADELMREWGFE